MQAFAPGIYPRSEALVQATRDLDRGRTTADAVAEQVERDREQLVAAQQEAELDLLADGMLTWQDLFRPLVEASDGLETGPLTRFLDTNSFYRAPLATTAEPRLKQPLDARYVAPLPGPRLVTFPSPSAFARGTGLAPAALAENVLRPAIEALDAELVVLADPFLARDDAPDVDSLGKALEPLRGGPQLVLQLTFGDARKALEAGIAELPVEGIGIDFYATHVTDVPEGFDKLLLAGVVDARGSWIEDPREVADFVARLAERVEGEIALVPNGDLQYVSEPIARQKLAKLGEAKRIRAEVPA